VFPKRKQARGRRHAPARIEKRRGDFTSGISVRTPHCAVGGVDLACLHTLVSQLSAGTGLNSTGENIGTQRY